MEKPYLSDKSLPDACPPANLPIVVNSLLDAVGRFFTSNPPPDNDAGDNAFDEDDDGQERVVELATAKKLNKTVLKQCYSIRPNICKLDVTDKVALFNDIDKELLPEVLAETLASLKYTKGNNLIVRAIMAHWTRGFSHEMKKYFLASAARYMEFVNMAEWMDMLRYNKFDLLMIANQRGADNVVRSLISWLTKNGGKILRQMNNWINYDIADTLTILRQSNFMTPMLERKIMPKLHNNMFVRAARMVFAHFRLPYPLQTDYPAFSLKYGAGTDRFSEG